MGKDAEMVRLLTGDKKIFHLERDIAVRSPTIKTELENLEALDAPEKDLVNLPEVTGATLEKVIIWMKMHKDDPIKPLKEEKSDDEEEEDEKEDDEEEERRYEEVFSECIVSIIPECDVEYLKPYDKPTTVGIAVAAFYLQLRDLVKSSSQTIANWLKGQNSSGMRAIFDEVAAGIQQLSMDDAKQEQKRRRVK